MADFQTFQYNSREHRRWLDWAEERFDFSEEGRFPHDELARRAYKHFRAFISEKDWQFETQLYEPKWTADLLTHAAREIQAEFAAPPLFRYLNRPPAAYEDARAMEALVDYYLDHMETTGVLWHKYLSVSLQRRMFGTVWGVPYWRRERRPIPHWRRTFLTDPISGQPIINPFTGEPIEHMVYSDAPVTLYDGPWFRVLHFTEAYPDHMTELYHDDDTNSDTWFIVRSLRPATFLEAKADQPVEEGGWPREMVNRALKTPLLSVYSSSTRAKGTLDNVRQTLEWQAEVGLQKPISFMDLEERKWFEVLEFWTPTHILAVVNRSYVMVRRSNPFGRIPVAQCKNIIVPGECYGMSDFELIERLNNALQDLRNVGMTVALLSANPIIRHSADVETRQLRHSIGAKWKIPSKDSVLDFLQVPPQGLQIAEVLQNSLRHATDMVLGTSDAYRGTDPIQGQTATAAQLFMQSAGLRSQYAIDTIAHGFSRPMADFYQWMIRMWGPHEVTVRVIGDPQAPPITINLEKLRDTQLVAETSVSTSQNRFLEERRIQELYDRVITAQEPYVDRYELFRMLVDVIAPRHTRRLVRDPRQVQAEMMARTASANAPEAQGARGGEGVLPSATAQNRRLVEPKVDELAHNPDLAALTNDLRKAVGNA